MMSERKEKFTPGPWHVRMYKHHTNRKSFVVRRTHQVVNQSELRVICSVASGCNADGNLDLIAAAPEMYEIIAKLEQMAFNGSIAVEDIQDILFQAVHVARKARGEE